MHLEPHKLERAIQLAEAITQWKNSMFKETSDLIVEMVVEIKKLQKESFEDAKYSSWLSSEMDRQRDDTYNCGEL